MKPKGQSSEDALLELREMGPLGIAPSSSGAITDPFASALVAQAFTDTPAVPIGRVTSSRSFPGYCRSTRYTSTASAAAACWYKQLHLLDFAKFKHEHFLTQ